MFFQKRTPEWPISATQRKQWKGCDVTSCTKPTNMADVRGDHSYPCPDGPPNRRCCVQAQSALLKTAVMSGVS